MSRMVVQSNRGRRLVGQLSPGEDLLQGLLSCCQGRQVRCGLVQAFGVVDELSVAHHEPARRSMGLPRHFRGPMQLLSASGLVSEQEGKIHLELNVAASRQTDNGIELLGGLCVGARVVACEFVIEVLDDLLVRRAQEPATGLSMWREVLVPDASAARAGIPAPPPGGDRAQAPGSAPRLELDPDPQAPDPRWVEGRGAEREVAVVSSDTVAAWSRSQQEEEDPVEEPPDDPGPYRPVRPGDILEHKQFGRCEVIRVSTEEDYVTVRLPSRRVVRLSLEVLSLRFEGEEEGRQVFRADTRGT